MVEGGGDNHNQTSYVSILPCILTPRITKATSGKLAKARPNGGRGMMGHGAEGRQGSRLEVLASGR
eukprot:9112729-Pyramimonas_sp.AAC.1